MRIFRSLLLALLASTASAQPRVSTPSSLTERLDSFFLRQNQRDPGFVLAISKNGTTIYRNSAGIADLNTITPIDSLTDFRMASVTKQFTAMGILLLEKEKKLSFDDPIGRW